MNDIRRKKPWYISDFTDALSLQSVASIFFLYFACLTPIITFGGLLGSATENRIVSVAAVIADFSLGNWESLPVTGERFVLHGTLSKTQDQLTIPLPQAAMESLMSGVVCGVIYGLFAGQPLTILGSTGPVLVFETIMYDFCKEQGLDYLSLRFWVGIWTMAILIFLVSIVLPFRSLLESFSSEFGSFEVPTRF